jgi:translation initiation factor IF-2
MKQKSQNLVEKPPVVVVLGHIDHGKSSLLQSIKELEVKITEKESGGITQHIGAYQVEKQNKKITFIDTPGHEAFSQMRSRGAKVADIAILVVAADEGVKPQTKEVILNIKEAELPIIVALNKMDKPAANPKRVKGELKKEGVVVESLGGKVPSVETSAQTDQGIEHLLELIFLVAEMEDLKADISKPAKGVIIESYLDKQRGPTATLILNEGILKLGDIVGTFSTFGKIKSLEDFQGRKIEKAYPAQPAIVIGFGKVPRVGENFKTFLDLESVKESIQVKEEKKTEALEVTDEKKILNLILKTDVLGSVEAIEEILKGIPQEKVILKILKSGVGEINENDIKLSKSARALVLGFRVKANPLAKSLAQKERVKIMNFEIIYDLVEGIRKHMEKILEPELVRTDLGKVRVLVKFWGEKNRQIAGGKITEGEVKKRTLIEIQRNEEVIGRGKMVNLQRNKKDIEKATKGQEVGILYEGRGKIEEGDTLVIFTKEWKKGEL